MAIPLMLKKTSITVMPGFSSTQIVTWFPRVTERAKFCHRWPQCWKNWIIYSCHQNFRTDLHDFQLLSLSYLVKIGSAISVSSVIILNMSQWWSDKSPHVFHIFISFHRYWKARSLFSTSCLHSNNLLCHSSTFALGRASSPHAFCNKLNVSIAFILMSTNLMH